MTLEVFAKLASVGSVFILASSAESYLDNLVFAKEELGIVAHLVS